MGTGVGFSGLGDGGGLVAELELSRCAAGWWQVGATSPVEWLSRDVGCCRH